MAKAVEDSKLVIVCMSENYKESPSCRTEAEYAFRLQKPVIPVRTESEFQASGWLGAFIGTKLYFDCTNVGEVPAVIPKILKDMNEILGPDSKSDSKSDRVGSRNGGRKSGGRKKFHSGWTKKRVQKWLEESKLTNLGQIFQNFDGELLSELKAMHDESPTTYYSNLQENLKIRTLEDILRFTKALKMLSNV